MVELTGICITLEIYIMFLQLGYILSPGFRG